MNTRSYFFRVIIIICIMSAVFSILDKHYTPPNISSTNRIITPSSSKQSSVLLSFKVGKHPGARGTYIEVKDGKKTIISGVYSKGCTLDFLENKSIILTKSDSSKKKFIIKNNILDLEVGNSFTSIYQNGQKVKTLKKFKFDFSKNEILK